MTNAVKSAGSTEFFTGDPTRPVVRRYRVVDPEGEHGNVLHKGYYSAVESLLDDRGIGDDLIELLQDADAYDDTSAVTVADCFHANQDAVDEILERHGYRIDMILKVEERK